MQINEILERVAEFIGLNDPERWYSNGTRYPNQRLVTTMCFVFALGIAAFAAAVRELTGT